MAFEYIHTELNKDIEFLPGYYTLEKEVRLNFRDRELMYVVGQGIVESSCCGRGGCRYALVPGYINKWKFKTNEDGLFVSEVEPIMEEGEKRVVREIITKNEIVSQVDFW